MENILYRTKGLLENKRKCRMGFAPVSSTTFRLKRPRINEVLQVLTGHCNLQKHRCTTAHDVSSTCPKCNLEEENPNHHVGECTYYQALRKRVFGEEKTTIMSVIEKLNINLLAKYLQQAGRLAEYGR